MAELVRHRIVVVILGSGNREAGHIDVGRFDGLGRPDRQRLVVDIEAQVLADVVDIVDIGFLRVMDKVVIFETGLVAHAVGDGRHVVIGGMLGKREHFDGIYSRTVLLT